MRPDVGWCGGTAIPRNEDLSCLFFAEILYSSANFPLIRDSTVRSGGNESVLGI